MGKKLFKSIDLMDMFGVTRNTLRFYEKKELLKPCAVDPVTGYRYYGFSEVEKLHLILLYKKSGMKLTEIKAYLEGRITAGELQKELYWRMEDVRNGLKILRSHVVQKNEWAVERVILPESVCVVKTFAVNGVESVAAEYYDCLSGNSRICKKYPDFIELLDNSRIDNTPSPDIMQINICMKADPDWPPEDIVVYPATEAVTTCHVGGYDSILTTYQALTDYMRENRLVANGYAREVFLLGPFAVDTERFITKIIIPVKSRDNPCMF